MIKWRYCPELVQFYGFRSVEVLLDTPPGSPKNCPEAKGGSIRVQISLSRPVSFFMVKPRLSPRQDQSNPLHSSRPLGFGQVLSNQPAASRLEHYSKILTKKGLNTPRKDNAPLLQCTHQMCPVRVHWHVKVNYKDYWRVKIAITNFNYRMNHTLWTLAVQHPNLNNVTQVFSFDYKSVAPYGSINDTGMFYGTKFYNDLLMEAGPSGNVQSEV
ncbi:hypothetical protein DY000_02018920 [Brassica cretica]|uniref:COBRA C-terminal domain-containing protein n=1 Tax=Brassica cretica TaxID=69181 RepID=A0ABQ7D6F6_BRACR|nr:hypothetical protein DY000_02018920 [Brassica cretica]